MICVVDKNNIIVNIATSEYPTEPNERTWYEWNNIGEPYRDSKPYKPPTEEEIQAQLEQGIEAWMNTVVAERHYNSIDTCIARYTDSSNPKYAQEAKAVKDWNTAIWDKCWDILAEVKAGTRPIPTLEEVIAELPVLVW